MVQPAKNSQYNNQNTITSAVSRTNVVIIIIIIIIINKDINMNFGLEKCARICLKKVVSKAKCI